MPFLTGLAIITLAPSWANIKLDAPGVPWAAQIALGDFAGLAALVAAAAILGRAVRRAAAKKRRRAADARLAALADPKRRWLAPSATFDPAPRAEPQMRRVQLRSSAPSEIAPTPAAAPGVAQAQPAATEPTPQAALAAVPEAAQAPTAMPEPAAQAISVPAPEAVQAPPAATEPVPQEPPPKRRPLYAELRDPVVPVPLPKHVVEARLADLMAPPLAALAPTPRPAQPKPAYVPASPTFAGGHVLASGLDARVFLRYRDAAGAVTDSIFQIYQVRASRPGGVIEQLHGYCFTAGACRIIPMRDVQGLGDEQTGNFIFDLDAFLLGTPVHTNPFGITLSPRGEYIRDPDAPLVKPPAAWLQRESVSDQEVRLLRSSAPSEISARPRGVAGARFLLRYLGSDATLSDRIVRVSSISLSDDGTILSLSAHCERADALRMFRRERIAALGDATTGTLHADIDAALRQSGTSVRRSGAVAPKVGATAKVSPGRGGLLALGEAQQAFAAMAPAERLASATRPVEPTPLKEKRPRGRPRKNAAQPPE